MTHLNEHLTRIGQPPLPGDLAELAWTWRLLSDADYRSDPLPAANDPSLTLRLEALHWAAAQPAPDADWILFIDDLRDPSYLTGWSATQSPHTRARAGDGWTVARDRWQAQALIARFGLPRALSFDHDYGDPELAGDGSGLARWISERRLDGLVSLSGVHWQVHSSNPAGAANIAGTLRALE